MSPSAPTSVRSSRACWASTRSTRRGPRRPSTCCPCRWAAPRTTTGSSARSGIARSPFRAPCATRPGGIDVLPAAHPVPEHDRPSYSDGRHGPDRGPGPRRPTPRPTTTAYATSITANQYQTFGGNFNISLNSSVTAIAGIEISADVSKTGDRQLLSDPVRALLEQQPATGRPGRGTGIKLTPNLTTTDTVRLLGGPTDLWNRTWTASQLSNTNFWVRAGRSRRRRQPVPPPRSSGSTICRFASPMTTKSTNPSIFTPDTNVAGPQGQALTARGFWGMMLTQGAETISGDAYLPFYDTAGQRDQRQLRLRSTTTTTRSRWPPGRPAAACGSTTLVSARGALQTGVGDTWISGSGLVSSFYDLYDTMGTPYDLQDDVAVAGFSSGTTFKHQNGTDPSLSGAASPGLAGCDAYHLGWYQLGTSTLTWRGHRARLPAAYHHHGPDRRQRPEVDEGPQRLGALHEGHRRHGPEIYGIGAMEMYTPLTSRRRLGVLSRPDRGRPRGQDDGDQALRRRRHQRRCQHPDPDPDDHGLDARRTSTTPRARARRTAGREQLQLGRRSPA